MADPLSLLREYVSGGKMEEVALAGDRVDFGGKFSFPKAALTGYKSKQGTGDFYTLETLLYFARHLDVKFGEYFKKAQREMGQGKAVTFTDRRELQEYLTGKTDRSEHIQLVVPALEVGREAKRQRLEPGGDGEAAAGRAAAPAAVEAAAEEAADLGMLAMVRANELQLRDRNSMLSVPGRSFRKVLTILSQAQTVQQAQLAQRRDAQQRRAGPSKPVIPVRPSGRYERQTRADATLKQLGAAELGVEVGFRKAATAPGDCVPPPPPPQQGVPPPPPPPSAPPASRPSGSRPSAAQQQQQQARRPAPRPAPQPQQRQRQGTPVIMVPPGMTALINMHNVRSFLEKGEFQTTEAAKAAAAEANNGELPAKEDKVTLHRSIGRKAPVKYCVTDKEPSSKEEWDRVVAVVCLGKPWQFKKWPFKGAKTGDLVDTFTRVMGVFLHYTDEKVDAGVKSWNVRILGLNRQSRHRDATVAQEFWRLLDSHLTARGSSLAF
ncbi:parafibromin-like isoform X2 [Micractinium conductrix]|uniref:Parafibromin-like isoform X2 n=1 Tax=Micractinium conductrix TaxID=554055 RepID=A0A2P6VHK0_9CHLO|nr:parafibromin-like isoform X2 [Micractinium conductrix]|eukprot:PSC73571.1 parafibromin-like isoform X2 [Micractinium conductrix]